MTYRCIPSAFPKAVLAEASRIAPGRRVSSDGICGDASHRSSGGDHVADWRGIPHAVDVSQSVPGAPFWDSRFQVFDAHRLARAVAARRDPRVKYLVIGQPYGPDLIWDPSVSLTWRQNGSYKTDHRSHLHVSFTVGAEQSTAPFFEVGDPPVTDAEIQKVVSRTVAALTPVIREQCATAVKNALGGYVGGRDPWVDGALAAVLRSERGLTKP